VRRPHSFNTKSETFVGGRSEADHAPVVQRPGTAGGQDSRVSFAKSAIRARSRSPRRSARESDSVAAAGAADMWGLSWQIGSSNGRYPLKKDCELEEASYRLSQRRRFADAATVLAIGIGTIFVASNASWPPFRLGLAVLGLMLGAWFVAEMIGLRRSEIRISEEAIQAPQGWGRRVRILPWSAVRDVRLVARPFGQLIEVEPVAGKPIRINVSEVHDGEELADQTLGLWSRRTH